MPIEDPKIRKILFESYSFLILQIIALGSLMLFALVITQNVESPYNLKFVRISHPKLLNVTVSLDLSIIDLICKPDGVECKLAGIHLPLISGAESTP